MAEISNADPQTNPRLREIFQILLLAGYFRIRIASLKPFDKIIGGLAWCITCSNFEVDIQYNDEMQIGQKIKVAQKICDALKKMKCPYNIQPYQLQGLDLNSIYPLIQWLIKFVYETREYRQKFNTALSNFLGGTIVRIKQPQIQEQKIALHAKRIAKNSHIKKASRRDPLRVYSTLIEFGDVTSTNSYNKLCALVTGKVANPQVKKSSKQGGGQKQTEGDKSAELSLASYLFELSHNSNDVESKIVENIGSQERSKFQKIERKLSFSGDELEKLVTESRQKIEEAMKVREEQQQTAEIKFAKLLAIENQSFENQKQLLNYKLASLQKAQKILIKKCEVTQQKADEIGGVYKAEAQKLAELEAEGAQLQKQIKQKTSANIAKTKQLEKMVEQRAKLKAEKTQIKKNAKGKLQELKKQKIKAIQNTPEINKEVFDKMVAQMDTKQKIYDERFYQLTLVNQEMAVLQRKVQNYASPAQVAQYQLRHTELIESINRQIERRKDLYELLNHLGSLKTVADNYVDIMRTFKQNYANSKSKDEKKEFIENLKEVFKSMQNNLKNSQTVLKKVSETKNQYYQEYCQMIRLERQFFTILKQLKIQIQVAQYEASRS